MPLFSGVSTRYVSGTSSLSLKPLARGIVTSSVIDFPGAASAAATSITFLFGKLGGRGASRGGVKPSSASVLTAWVLRSTTRILLLLVSAT